MKYIFLFSTLILTSLTVFSQSFECGSTFDRLSPEEQAAALAFYQQDFRPLSQDRAVRKVGLTIYLVRSVLAGLDDFNQDDIDNEIEKVNIAYRGTGVEFFLCGSPRVIQGLGTYDFSSGDELNRSNHVPNTINIFFVENLQINADAGLCGYAQFPWRGERQERYIMMNQDCSTNGSTLSHEIGHFYGLLHTHETFQGVERVDGSNCTTAGDLVCDTPADPRLNRNGIISGCTYQGNFVDQAGDRYVPDPSNLMSYAPSFCRNRFTPGQWARVAAISDDLNAYLIDDCDFYPDFAMTSNLDRVDIQSDEDITVTYDFDSEGITETFDIEFKVSLADLPDDIGLVLHTERITISPGQAPFSRTIDVDFPITKGTGTYYLKSTLDSEFKVIERTEQNNKFTTVVKVDNSNLNDALVFPNPAQDELKMFFRDNRASGAFDVRIFALDGRFIKSTEGFKNQEEFFQLIDVTGLHPGLYVVKVDFEKVNREYVFKFVKD